MLVKGEFHQIQVNLCVYPFPMLPVSLVMEVCRLCAICAMKPGSLSSVLVEATKGKC